MEDLFWCSRCKAMSESAKGHDEHDITKIGNGNRETTIIALDDVIQFGVESLQRVKDDVKDAQKAKKEIDTARRKVVADYRAHIERCVKDFREAMEQCGVALMDEMNAKLGKKEREANLVISASGRAQDTITAFVKEAATILPDDEGNVAVTERVNLFNHYLSVAHLEEKPQLKFKSVSTNIKYPSSMQTKNECMELAKRITLKCGPT